jgi:hypothetical protein
MLILKNKKLLKVQGLSGIGGAMKTEILKRNFRAI